MERHNGRNHVTGANAVDAILTVRWMALSSTPWKVAIQGEAGRSFISALPVDV